MKKLLFRWLIVSLVIWGAAEVLPGISVEGGALSYAAIALIFGLINATLGSLTKLLTFPFAIVTLGLSMLVVNALMLTITDNLRDDFAIESFWWALALAALISVSSVFKVGSK